MQHDDDSLASFGLCTHKLQHADGVGWVEEGGGFVEKQHWRVLSQGKREPYPLALPTRKRRDIPIDEVSNASLHAGLRDDVAVLRGQALAAAQVRVAPTRDELAHPQPVRRRRLLREKGHVGSCFLRTHGVHVELADVHTSLPRAKNLRQGLQQRGLSAAVRPNERGDFARAGY